MTVPMPLSSSECRDLLESGVVGRVAMATPVGPRIVPLNYRVRGNSIVFRTAPYSELSTYGWDTDLAFEVDDYDRESHSAWSVVALGRAHALDDPDEVQRTRLEHELWPWASGSRNVFVELPWRELTGVRLGDDWTKSATARRRSG